jgi:ubiquinone/menaquinone biosynthesis C-methylase UbiE
MSRLEQSIRPTFQVDRRFAQQYDAFVRVSPLYRNLVQELIERSKIGKGDRVLCLASGTGLDARAASEAGAESVIGLDRSMSMVTVAREMSGAGAKLRFLQGDAAAIPFPDQHFDVVLINAAGNYLWDNIYSIFRDVHRVLKPQGVFAFNCQSDEIENIYTDDPQRQLRRSIYQLGQSRGYAVRLSAKPSVPLISQLAKAVGLSMSEAASVKVPTDMDDALQQLRLPQFHVPFLGSVPEEKRDELLRDTVDMLKLQEVAADSYRYWHFFVFRKHA